LEISAPLTCMRRKIVLFLTCEIKDCPSTTLQKNTHLPNDSQSTIEETSLPPRGHVPTYITICKSSTTSQSCFFSTFSSSSRTCNACGCCAMRSPRCLPWTSASPWHACPPRRRRRKHTNCTPLLPRAYRVLPPKKILKSQ
jgi:hypothetical protein